MKKQYVVVAVDPEDSYRSDGLEGCVIEFEDNEDFWVWKNKDNVGYVGGYTGDFTVIRGRRRGAYVKNCALCFYCWPVEEDSQ